MRLIAVSMSLVLLACAAAVHAAPNACAFAAGSGLACAPTPRGAVLAADPADAERIARYAAAGERRFRRYLGRAPAPYVVAWGVDGAGSRLARSAGAPVVFSHLNAQQRLAASEAATRVAVKAQLEAAKVPAEQLQAAIAQAMAAQPVRSLADEAATDVGVVPHELGHLWFHAAFWPEADNGSLDFYVTPAPDWLDEAAALMMEPADAGAEFDRRAAFAALLGDRSARVANLPILMAREHPGQVLKTAPRPANGWSMAELKALGVDAGAIPTFYAQSATFAAFLVERSRRDAVLGDIAAWLARGGTLESWLATHGRRSRVGRNVDELEAAWQAWVARSFPIPTPA